jgi:hypothetical protein
MGLQRMQRKKGAGRASARRFRAIEAEVYAYTPQLPRFTVFCMGFQGARSMLGESIG